MGQRVIFHLVGGLLAIGVLAGCGASSPTEIAEPTAEAAVPEPTVAPTAVEVEQVETTAEPENDGLFPTVVDVTATAEAGSSYRFDVTLRSEYDSPQRYADAWRVLDADDNELGIRVLTHDHAGEQPFTRSASVDIPGDVAVVFVEGRDQLNGWSGERYEVALSS